jgi:hypothetical protein
MSARARACYIMIVLTHVVACDGQKAKLIANLEQIALLHRKKSTRDRRQNRQNVMEVLDVFSLDMMFDTTWHSWRTWLRVTDNKRTSLRFLNKLRYYIELLRTNEKNQTERRDAMSSRHHDTMITHSGIIVSRIVCCCWVYVVTQFVQESQWGSLVVRHTQPRALTLSWWHHNVTRVDEINHSIILESLIFFVLLVLFLWLCSNAICSRIAMSFAFCPSHATTCVNTFMMTS